MTRYYDTRFFLLPVFTFLKTYSSSSSADVDSVKSASNGWSLFSELISLAVISVSFLFFLTVSIRIQFCCFFHPLARFRRIELRIGEAELSVPVTLSLVVTLYVPSSSTFWGIYLFILVASLFSDAVHSFLTRFSYHLCFVVWRDHESTLPAPHGDEESVLPTSSNHLGASEH